IEANEALRPIEVHELAGQLARVRGPTDHPHEVALGGFDLDDLGAVVGEPERRRRPDHNCGEIDDLDASQQRRSHRHSLLRGRSWTDPGLRHSASKTRRVNALKAPSGLPDQIRSKMWKPHTRSTRKISPRSSTKTSLLATRFAPGAGSGRKCATSRGACGRAISMMRIPGANQANRIAAPGI